jgi:hypothetical protein
MPTYSTAGGRGAVLVQNPFRSLHAAQRQNLIGMTVDHSDSMDHLSEVAVRSLNELITQQKEIGVESRFTLTLFNNQISTIHDGIPLCDVPPLTRAQYEASGGTALNDAIAHLIRTLSARAPGQGHSVLAVILTDGIEVCSRQYRIEDVRQMVSYRRAIHRWQFLFLGPESAIDYATRIGIPKVNTAGFETTPDGLRLMLERVSRAIGSYRLGDSRFMLALQGGRQKNE